MCTSAFHRRESCFFLRVLLAVRQDVSRPAAINLSGFIDVCARFEEPSRWAAGLPLLLLGNVCAHMQTQLFLYVCRSLSPETNTNQFGALNKSHARFFFVLFSAQPVSRVVHLINSHTRTSTHLILSAHAQKKPSALQRVTVPTTTQKNNEGNNHMAWP